MAGRVGGSGLPRAHHTSHITILTPFFAESELDDALHANLREICGGIATFEVKLVSVERLPGFTVLALEPEQEPRALRAALRERWPQFVPYNGRHGEDPTPHPTVVWPGPEERHERVATEAKALLPLSERAPPSPSSPAGTTAGPPSRYSPSPPDPAPFADRPSRQSSMTHAAGAAADRIPDRGGSSSTTPVIIRSARMRLAGHAGVEPCR
jgi:2'-5' RNA ligase superfamily